VRTLLAGSQKQGVCISLTWYRGPGHKFIAASFMSGLIAVWDITTTSALLCTNEGILPIASWYAHSSSATGVSFASDLTEFPKFCVTGGTDRTYRFWDLRDTTNPFQEVKRGMVTAVSWLPGHAAASVSHDDVFLQAHTQTLLTENGFHRAGSQPVVGQNSCVWDQSVSMWLGGMAICTSAGELVLYMLPDATRPVDQNRASGRRRAYVYLTKLITENIEESTESYKHSKDQCCLDYYDLWEPGSLTAADKENAEKVRYSEKMESENLSRYPLSSVNRVNWNPNLDACFLIASGGQSGLVRVHTLTALNSDSLKEAALNASQNF